MECKNCTALQLRIKQLEKELAAPILVNTVRLLEERSKAFELCGLYASQYQELYLIAKRHFSIAPLMKRHVEERESLLKQVCLDEKTYNNKTVSWKEPNVFKQVKFVGEKK